MKVQGSSLLDKKTKRSVAAKIKNVYEAIQTIEQMTGVKYPIFYIEPVLTVSSSNGPAETLGVMYARTIPIQVKQGVAIVVELTAPLILYATKATLRIVLAHEFLHYVALVRSFSRMDVTTQITADTLFEERYADSSRAVDPSIVFGNKRFAKALAKKTGAGLDDPKLNEKCRSKWLEKGMPVTRISMGTNQVSIAVDSILRTEFDPKVREIASRIP